MNKLTLSEIRQLSPKRIYCLPLPSSDWLIAQLTEIFSFSIIDLIRQTKASQNKNSAAYHFSCGLNKKPIIFNPSK